MQVIEARQAQVIVDRLMEDIPFNINIMDAQGIIIASGEKDRIGHRHYAAVQSISKQKRIEVYRDTVYEKKGTNTPIVYQNDIIGVVGISGEPSQVTPFANIVSSFVVLLIQEKSEFKNEQKRLNQKKHFVKKMIDNIDGNYDEELITEGLDHYKVNLMEENACILSKNKKDLEEILDDHEIFYYESFYFCLVSSEMHSVLSGQLESSDLSDIIIIGEPQLPTPSMIMETLDYWYLADFFQLANKVVPSDIKAFTFLNSVSETLDDKIFDSVKEIYQDYYETLIVFAKTNCNYNETSKQLHIHRNTLAYRLQRITDMTGLNPNLWYELCTLLMYFMTNYKAIS
ncbi:CdaR family transcriptional regulator [Streptococcus jiangjianxini]|uniref:CdaR family transcriptional regulator n=1 Tax=Streptococcus jiangjianxini TaxID=3161189 RepID=UPI0032EDA3D2